MQLTIIHNPMQIYKKFRQSQNNVFPFLQNVFFVALKWVWKSEPQIYSCWSQVSPHVTSCSPILQSGSLEPIKYHWRGKAGPAFFPGSHCALLSLRCHHTGVHTPPRLCGHQWPDNASMFNVQERKSCGSQNWVQRPCVIAIVSTPISEQIKTAFTPIYRS